MLKYSVMSFSCPELPWEDFVQAAHWYTYRGVEPRIEAGHAHGIEPDTPADTIAEARRIAADKQMEIACLATSRRLAAPDDAQAEIDLTKRCIDLAAALGAPKLRVFGGPLGEMSREDAIVSLASNLAAVADHARDAGLAVCLETHDEWTNPDHVAAVMRTVDHPAIGVNWDIMHPVRVAKWTMEESYKALAPWIQHVHVHDGTDEADKLVLLPIGEGDIDHKAALKCLVDSGYEGFVSGEWIAWEDWAIHLPREVAKMRELEAEVTKSDE